MKKKKKHGLIKYPKLREKYKIIKKMKDEHLGVCEKIMSAAEGRVYLTDYLVYAILKRSLDTMGAIEFLVKRRNITASVALLRLQLDSLLRIIYLAKNDNPDKVCYNLLSGKSFRNMKDKNGKKLTDVKLRDYARDLFPWIDEVYEKTSKLIHLSEKHIFLTIEEMSENEREMTLSIGEGNANLAESEYLNLINSLIVMTKHILEVANGWLLTKKILYDKKKKSREKKLK